MPDVRLPEQEERPYGRRNYSISERRPAPHIAPLTFVGGTGRSGTHVVSHFLGHHRRISSIGVECRFHVEDRGFPGLLEGSVSKQQFLERLRGFWWRGRLRGRERGLFKLVPEERFRAAVAAFDDAFDEDAPEAACRQLFLDLLWPRAIERWAAGLVEQSCDTVAAAPTLVRLFPEARFVHVVRDGRDASASRVAQTRGIVYPRTRRQGIDWFERRLRNIEQGARQIPEDRLLQVSLEEILTPPRHEAAEELAGFVGVKFGRRMRRFFYHRMDLESANKERWREGLSERRQRSLAERYVDSLERMEADGISSAPILRAVYERSPASS